MLQANGKNNIPQGCRVSGELEKAQKKASSLLCFFCRSTDGFTVRPCGIMFNLQFLISMGSCKSAIDRLISVVLFPPRNWKLRLTGQALCT